jgi:hypothetical protein
MYLLTLRNGLQTRHIGPYESPARAAEELDALLASCGGRTHWQIHALEAPLNGRRASGPTSRDGKHRSHDRGGHDSGSCDRDGHDHGGRSRGNRDRGNRGTDHDLVALQMRPGAIAPGPAELVALAPLASTSRDDAGRCP